MGWKDKISGAFGEADKRFAGHEIESRAAADLLNAANKEGVGLTEYLKEIENWLKAKGCSPEHIVQELANAKDISKYFTSD